MNKRDQIAALMGPLMPPHADAPQGRTIPTKGTRTDARGLLDYYLGPTGVPQRLAAANQMLNPVEGIGQSMRASQRAMAPETSPWGRFAAVGDMLSGVAGVAAPMAAAGRVGAPAANAVVDALTGVSAAGKQAAGEFAMDESGALRLFHGSPHDFDKFSMDKIGTGEGKQAEGYGLYFAENQGVAERYRDVLSAKDGGSGRVYEVEVDASPEDFVDFDQPLGGQSDLVRGWFDSRGVSPMFAGDQSGQELMMLERAAMGDEALAESLRNSGIPGVRYRDAGSPFRGEGTRNYVVFDENLISIVRKYGIAGAAAMLGATQADVAQAMQQGNQ